jgi:hypothetical protein
MTGMRPLSSNFGVSCVPSSIVLSTVTFFLLYSAGSFDKAQDKFTPPYKFWIPAFAGMT